MVGEFLMTSSLATRPPEEYDGLPVGIWKARRTNRNVQRVSGELFAPRLIKC